MNDIPVLSPLAPRAKLADEITDAIRQAILTGAYADGQRLNVDELARQLGVSAMPVREALSTLYNEGLTRNVARRGFFASPLDHQDLEDLFDLHAHISGILAARAASIATDDDLDQLALIERQIESLASQRQREGAAGTLEQLNQEFHRRINTLPPGKRLRAFVRETSRYVPGALYESTSEWLDATLRDHPPILSALRRRDAALVRTLMESHIRQGADILTRAVAARQISPETPQIIAPSSKLRPRASS